MSVGSADLHKAINTAWDGQSLDGQFTTYWSGVTAGDFSVLHDGQAAPGTPMPYCVMRQGVGDRVEQMRGHENAELHEIRDIPIDFEIHAKKSGSTDAKTVAAALAEEVMKIYGGHPTVAPQDLSLDNGDLLDFTYQQDQGVWEGDDEYMWMISYKARVDAPVKVLA